MNEITRPQLCLLLKNGMQIWQDKEKLELLRSRLESRREGFISVDGEFLSISEIAGIFSPERMKEYTMKKNKQWQCKFQFWHNYTEKCFCVKEPICIKCHKKNPESFIQSTKGILCVTCT
jgi:hypothetical protein